MFGMPALRIFFVLFFNSTPGRAMCGLILAGVLAALSTIFILLPNVVKRLLIDVLAWSGSTHFTLSSNSLIVW